MHVHRIHSPHLIPGLVASPIGARLREKRIPTEAAPAGIYSHPRTMRGLFRIDHR